MDTPIKIKKERIDPDYDNQESSILPMPVILPKVEPSNDYIMEESCLSPHTSTNIKIKLEPMDFTKNLKETVNPESLVTLPLPLIVKNENSHEHDSTLIDNLLNKLDDSDSLLEEIANIEKDTTNVTLGQDKGNIEEGEIIETNSNLVITKVMHNEIESREKRGHSEIESLEISRKAKKEYKKRKKIKELAELNVKENITAKRTHNESDSAKSESSLRHISKKKKRKDKHKHLSSSLDVITEIPLVRDYNHKSISGNRNIMPIEAFPKPRIIQVEPNLVLPKPMQQFKNENPNLKNIKLEEYLNPAPIPIDTVLKRSNTIINNMEIHEKRKYSTRILYTPINFIPSINSSNNVNRSPLLCIKNVQYMFNSSSKINYKEFGIISLPEIVGKLGRIIGFQTDQLTSKIVSTNIKSENDVNKSVVNNSRFSSFYINTSSQTDQLPCEKCIIRQFSKRVDIAIQTEREDDLPMIKEFHTLNMNQQLALNDFYSIIISGQPNNANDKLKLRDRLVQIFDMANQQVINPPSIAPPAPALPSNSYNLSLPHSLLGYPAPVLPSNSYNSSLTHSLLTTNQPVYEHFYQPPQQMVLNHFQHQQMLLNSQHIPRNTANNPRNKPIDPRNKPNDPRNGINSRHVYDNYSREYRY